MSETECDSLRQVTALDGVPAKTILVIGIYLGIGPNSLVLGPCILPAKLDCIGTGGATVDERTRTRLLPLRVSGHGLASQIAA